MERTLFQLTQAISAYRIDVVHAQTQNGRSAIIQTSIQVFFIKIISIKLIVLIMWNKLY